jgi:1-acyl-sn-glycerol-3-phosphate acyltransferase
MPGNALVEMGTFLAILLGTLLGGLLAAGGDRVWISVAVMGLAALGYGFSRWIPSAPSSSPQLKIDLNFFRQTWELIARVRRKPSLFNSILGISWFWFFGATVLAQLPNFTQHTLHADKSSVTFLLAVFSLSVGFGSLICAKLSRGEIELGLVPLGAIGLTLFCGDLGWASYPPPSAELRTLSEWLSGPLAPMGWRVVIDLAGIGLCGSLFIVPLYALIQYRADDDSRSRVIAANNVLNALFMVASALLTLALYGMGFTTTQILLYTAVLNIAVSAYIFLLIPEFLMRFSVWILASTIYRMRYTGRHHVPREGAALIICNHVSFIDWFVITAASRRPVRFVMDHSIFKMQVLGWIFKLSKAIPIAPAKEDPNAKEAAFTRIAQDLKDGHLVCIFPEGSITRDGTLNRFRPGVNRILRDQPVPVIPMALQGLWGSFFSRARGKAMSSMPRPSRRIITATVEAPMPPTTRAEEMEAQVKAMLERD